MHFNLDLLSKVLVIIDQNIQNLRPAKLRWRPLTEASFQALNRAGSNGLKKRGWLFFVYWQVDTHTGLSPTSVRPRLFGCFST